MNNLLGPVHKTDDKQQPHSPEPKSAPSKQRRGSIAKGRTVSTSEDDTRGAASPLEDTTSSLGVGGLTGARVVLPIITEDEDGHGGTDDWPPQYLPADKKLVLPSLVAAASLRDRRNSNSVKVQLEVAGRDLQLPPSKGAPPDKSRSPSWQANKSKQLPVVLPHNWVETEFEDDIVFETIPHEPLRHILQCHSFGIPMKITKQDYRSGRYATPLFHCQRCLDLFKKVGRVPKGCSEPKRMVSGEELLLSDQTFDYIKDIWDKHLVRRIGKADQLMTQEIRNLLKKGNQTSRQNNMEDSGSEYTSEDGDVSQTSNHMVSVKHKRRRRKGSVHKVSHEGITTHSGHKIKKTKRHRHHERHRRNRGEEGDDKEAQTVSDDEGLDAEDSHHTALGGSRETRRRQKKNKTHRAGRRRNRLEYDEEDGSEAYSVTDDSMDDEDSHHQALHDSQGGSKRGDMKKKRRSKAGKKGKKTEHDMEGGSEAYSVTDDSMDDADSHHQALHDSQGGSKRGDVKNKRRSKTGKKGKKTEHGEKDGEILSHSNSDDEDSFSSRLDDLKKRRQKKRALKEKRRREKAEKGEEDDGNFTDEDCIENGDGETHNEGRRASKGHHKKKRRNRNTQKGQREDHGEEEDSSSNFTDEDSIENGDGKIHNDGRRGSKGHHRKKRRSRHTKKKQREDDGGLQEGVSDNESPDGEYSHHQVLSSSHDGRKKHHKKKRRHSRLHSRSKIEHGQEEDSETFTVSDDDSLDHKEYKSHNGRKNHVKKKHLPKAGSRKNKQKHENEDDSESYTVSEEQTSDNEDSYHDIDDGNREVRNSKTKKKRHSKGGRKEKKAEYNGEEDGSDAYTVSEDEIETVVDHASFDSHGDSKHGHKKKKRHLKTGKKGKRTEHDKKHDVDGSDSGVFILPGRHEDNELEAGSSYDELLSRLIDDYESQNPEKVQNSTLPGTNQAAQHDRQHGRTYKGQISSQHSFKNQKSNSRISTSTNADLQNALTDRSSTVYSPESYNRHARRQSQGNTAVIKSFSGLPNQESAKSRRESIHKVNKPVIRNTMVKNKTGKPATQKGHLKGNIGKKAAADPDAPRKLKTAPEQSSNAYVKTSDTSQSSVQLSRDQSSVSRAGGRSNENSSVQVADSPSSVSRAGGRSNENSSVQVADSPSSVSRAGGRSNENSSVQVADNPSSVIRAGGHSNENSSVQVADSPSEQVFDGTTVATFGEPEDKASHTAVSGNLPQRTAKRTRKMSQVPWNKARQASDLAHNSRQVEVVEPNAGRRSSQVPRTASNILSSWATSSTDVPNFRFNTGSRPPSSIGGVENPNDANHSAKMEAPPIPTLPTRSESESGREAKSKPVAEVKPNVIGKRGTETPASGASSLSSSTPSMESLEGRFEELERLSKRRNAIVIPDFGGLSALSFTPAFTFSFYPRLVVHDTESQNTGSKKSPKKIPVKNVAPIINVGVMNKETASKPKTDITRMSRKMQHRVANPKPIAKFVKKPPPENRMPGKKKHTKRSSHKVNSPYQTVTKVASRTTAKIRKHSTSNVNIKPSLISDSGLKLQPSRISQINSHRSKTSSRTKKVLPSPRTSGHAVTVEHVQNTKNYEIEVDPDVLKECESVIIQVTDYI